MGDGPAMPWRLLHISILVEDRETGGKFESNFERNLRFMSSKV